jgi:hypothetical protein
MKLVVRDPANRPIFCCEKMEKCSFQGFVLRHGLSWGRIEDTLEAWRKAHSEYCGGRLVQLIGTRPRNQAGTGENDVTY